MGIHDDFLERVISHPEYEKIREELCTPEDQFTMVEVDLGNGIKAFTGGANDPELTDNDWLFTKMCWYINNGPGYCADAPENIKVYLRRLGIV